MLIQLQMVSDGRIVRRVLGGRRDEFGVLVNRYYGAVQSVARARLENPADIEDVAQEAFISAWRRLDTLATPNRFGPWLMSIARNAAVSWARRRREVLVPDATDLPEQQVVPAVERDELQRFVRGKLLEMEPDQREILMLHYYGGKSLGEVALLLEISRAAAGKRLQRARAVLGNEFLKAVGEAPHPETGKGSVKAVMAAIAAAPVAWQSKAAAAGAASVVLVKVLLPALAVLAIGAGTTVAVKYAQSEPATEPVAAPVSAEQVAQAESPATDSAATPGPEESQSEPTGPGRTECILINNDTGQPVGDVDVMAELVNWGPHEMPPASTFKKTVHADAAGKFVFENMPEATYCVSCVTPTLCGVQDFLIKGGGRGYGHSQVPMYPRVSLKGRLMGANGAPVAGALIYPIVHFLYPDTELDHPMIASVRAVTEADGGFAFPAIMPGAWKFYILAPGMPATVTDFKITEGEVLLSLEDPGSMAGRLTDAGTGEPVSGIKLLAFQGRTVNIANPSARLDGEPARGWRVMAETVSDADGAFRVPSLSPGKYKIELADAVLLNASPEAEFEVSSGAETSVEVRAAVSASILGRVYNKETGEGLAGMMLSGPETIVYSKVLTDANGEYAFTGVKPGAYRLMLGIPQATGGFVFGGESPSITLTVALGQVLDNADIAMSSPYVIRGRVVDRNGQPVAGATVRAYGRQAFGDAVTDAVGDFILKNVFSMDNLRLSAKKDAWQSEVLNNVDPSEETLLSLNLPAGSAIQGMARGADGNPLVLHEVTCWLEQDEGAPHAPLMFLPSERTGATGEFKLENLRAGTYRVEARPIGQQGSSPASATVTVGENEVVRNVRLQPQRQGEFSISGVVRTCNGGPLYETKVQVPWGQSARIGADGRFTIGGLPDDEYTLVFTSAGYSPAVISKVAAGTTNVTATLYPPAVMVVKATDAATGQPVSPFDVHCAAEPELNWTTFNTETYANQLCNSESGELRIENFAAVPVSVTVNADGYVPQKQLVTLKGGELNSILFQLEAGVAVTGTVVSTAGTPIPGVEIATTVWGPEDRVLDGPAVRSDENGAFAVDTLSAGLNYTLTASHAGYGLACVDLKPVKGGEKPICFVLEQAGAVEIHAFRDGQPDMPCFVRTDNSCVTRRFFMERMNPWIINQVPPGEIQITVEMCTDGLPAQTVAATVVPGQTTVVEVNFESQEDES